MLDIFHYLHTMNRKPGSLARSTALLQADAKIRELYEKYYSRDPKSFLPVLELIAEIGVDSVEKTLLELSKRVNHDFSAEKLRLVYEHRKEASSPQTGRKEDKLSRRAKSTLRDYDRLRELQSGRAG